MLIFQQILPFLQKRYGPTDRRTDGPTNGPTDRPTNRPTDRRTDKPSYRDAIAASKNSVAQELIFSQNYDFSSIHLFFFYEYGLFWLNLGNR